MKGLVEGSRSSNQNLEGKKDWRFQSFVDAHVPDGPLRWKGVRIPRAVPKYLENTLVTALQQYFARKWQGKLSTKGRCSWSVVRGSLHKDSDVCSHGYSSDGPKEFDFKSNDVNGSLQLTTENRQLTTPRKAFEQRRALLFHFHQTKVGKEDLSESPSPRHRPTAKRGGEGI